MTTEGKSEVLQARDEEPTEEKKHPLLKANCFSKFLMCWISAPLKLQKEVSLWTQDIHYDLPDYDLIVCKANKLFKNFKRSRSIFGAILKTYGWELWKIFFLIIIYTALNFSTAFCTSIFVEKIQNSEGKISQEDKYLIPGLFTGILLALFFSSAIFNYVTFQLNRMSYLARSSLNFLIFQKILNFDVLNGVFSEGKIVNMIQVDCSKFEQMLQNCCNLVAMSMSLIAGCIYMALILGAGTVIAFFGAFLISGFLLIVVYSWRMRVIKQLMKAKDKRIALLKNVI